MLCGGNFFAFGGYRVFLNGFAFGVVVCKVYKYNTTNSECNKGTCG